MFTSLFSRRHNFVLHGQNCSDVVFILRNMYAKSQSDFKNFGIHIYGLTVTGKGEMILVKKKSGNFHFSSLWET